MRRAPGCRCGGAHAGTTISRKLRMVRGSHLVVPRQWKGEHGYFLQTRDGRLMEAFPYEDDFTLIGTTDEPWDDAAGEGCDLGQGDRLHARRGERVF